MQRECIQELLILVTVLRTIMLFYAFNTTSKVHGEIYDISLGLGITYIIVQTLGAFLGNAFSYIITDKHATPVLTFDKTFPWNVVMSEFIAVINFAYKF